MGFTPVLSALQKGPPAPSHVIGAILFLFRGSGASSLRKEAPESTPASYGTAVTVLVLAQKPSSSHMSVARMPVIQSGEGAIMWMAETFECCSSRNSFVLFLNVLGFAEPHESTRPVTRQRERACGCTTLTNSVGLPVVAILATPWVANMPHAGSSPPWVYTTVGEMCATGSSESAPAKSKG